MSPRAVPAAVFQQACTAAGGKYVGLQPGDRLLLLFNDASGSTRALDLEAVVTDAVRDMLTAPRREHLAAVGVQGVAELRALRLAVELAVELLSYHPALESARPMVQRRMDSRGARYDR